jgi:hypothetical protein
MIKKLRNYIPFLICFFIMATMLSLLYTNTELGDEHFFLTRNGQSFFEFIKIEPTHE